MEFLPPWPPSVNTLFFFGVLLFCGSIGGFMAHHWPWLPSITGFMLVGFVAGPNVLGLFSHEQLASSAIVIDVSLGLILYRLGLSLDIKQLVRSKSLMLISLVESGLTFFAVYALLGWIGIASLPAAVIAALAISSSPAVLIHVAHELGASGPVTNRAQSLVALNNVIAFVVFAALLPALYTDGQAPRDTVIGAPLYSLLGSAVLGAVVGVMLHYTARRFKAAQQYHLALVIGAVMLTLGAALMLKLSALFAPLVLGMVVRGIERKDLISDMEFGPAFELFFIVLFVYAGANLHVSEMLHYAPAAAVFLAARALAKWLGVAVTASMFRLPARESLTTGLLLFPMAGLAIGLVNTTTTLFPAHGAVVGSIVLAAVAVVEAIGPPIVMFALRLSGDTLEAESPGAVPGEELQPGTASLDTESVDAEPRSPG
jgi:Kef-type K+ transport system membrane component KefB